MGTGNGGSLLVYTGTNSGSKEGTTAMMNQYRNLLKRTKQAVSISTRDRRQELIVQ